MYINHPLQWIQILFTALRLEGCTDERLIPKMIFFVHDVRETTELRALLVQWLELRLRRQLLYISNCKDLPWGVKVTDRTRKDIIETRFDSGDVCILVRTP
jgi:hypothetical protein